MTQAIRQQEAQELIVFRACYRVEHPGVVGAPMLMLQLLIDPLSKRVSGFGRLTQIMYPPLELTTQLNGEFRNIPIPNMQLTIVTATGHPPTHLPPIGEVGPISLPNFQLLMVLPEGWQKPGIADYEYRLHPEDPHWQVVRNAEAAPIPCDAG